MSRPVESRRMAMGRWVPGALPGHDVPWRTLLASALLCLLLGGLFAHATAWGRSASVGYPPRIDSLIEQASKLTAAGESGEGRFGYRLALSSDGQTALIGARDDDGRLGAAWVFARSGSSWVQQGPKLTGGEESGEARFGDSVALSGDGQTALIGGPRDDEHGAAWVFVRSGSSWVQQGPKLTAGEESERGHFGRSVALSADGATALVGGSANGGDRGAAWVFTRSGDSWAQQGPQLTGGEEIGDAYFGHSLALSGDGDTALIGGPGDDAGLGAAWVFTRSGTTWTQQGAKLTGGEESGEGRLGYSVALSADAGTALLGGRSDGDGGAAWVFTRSGAGWSQQGPKLTGGEESGNAEFGYNAALSGDGGTALVGGPGDDEHLGAAWLFTRSGTTWTQQGAKLTGDEETQGGWFGESVALSSDGETGLVGAPHDNIGVGAVWTLLGASGPPPPRPSVTRVTPAEGPAAGGTPVTILGSGFLAGAKVTIGSQATTVDVRSSTEITAVTAATAPGGYEAVVADSNGTSAGGPLYAYLSPTTPPEPPGSPPPPGSPGTSGTSTGAGGTSAGATGAAGTTTASSGVLGTIAGVLPAPTLAVSGNLAPVSGTVLVKLPGSSTFVLLSEALQVPFGTIVDATNGKVSVTTARLHGGSQTMTFYGGQFKLTQSRNGLVVAKLTGGDFSVCPTARERSQVARTSAKHASGNHSVRKLWSEGHGSYSTQGNYAVGAVLGTRWLTADLCDGTLIRVATDRVAVTNLVNHRHRTVRAGHSYLAKAP